jgi:tRNA U34 2-thiouridine synthase MnmA/TrmU
MVENPKFGYGKNLNPCVDCRVFMLNWAKEYSKEVGASFLVTGEVLNQRPLSQRRFRFIEIDKEVGMEGLILRPLSAKLLPPTLPEKYGIVDREKLYSICGRSRKVQLKLAKEFGLEEIAQPAGGCLLTSPEFSARLKALFSIKKFNTPKDIQLLKIGRHFKISPNALFIVARDEKECEILEEEFKDCGIIIKSNGKGPIGLLYNSKEESDILTASKILSVYTKKVTPTEECKFYADGIVITLSEKPSFDFIEQFRVTATI